MIYLLMVMMKKYLDLCLKGEESIPERKIILDTKLRELENKMKEIQEAINFVHWKQNFYNDVLSGKIKYFSYLIKRL